MTKTTLSRRTMLRSLTTGVGVAVGLPIFEAMLNTHGDAFAGGEPLPVRYGTFFWGNGVRPDRWVPNKMGAQWWEDPNEELVSIANTPEVRERVNILSGFRMVPAEGTAHHMPRGQVLTGSYTPSPGGACCGAVAGPSADWIVRQQWAGQSLLRDAVDVGISQTNKGASSFGISSGTVFDDDGNARPLEMSPRAVFDSLFGNGLPDDVPQVDLGAFQDSRYSMVDLVREDAARLRAKLGANDQQRIDAHLEQLLEVERSIDALDTASACAVPKAYPEAADYYRQQVMLTQDGQPATITGELLTEKNEVMANLIALALACDLTRVFTYQHHGMQTDTVFWNLPSVSLGHHQCTHDDRGNSPDPQAVNYQAVHEIAEYTMSQFNVLLKALAAMPEGASDVLDNCAIYAVSEYGDATSHSQENLSILTAGRAGGTLRGGYHLDGAGRFVQDVPLTLMQAAGVDVDGFGQGNLRSTTPFDALLSS